MTSSLFSLPHKPRGFLSTLGFAVALLVLVVGSFFGYRSVQRTIANEQWVAHSDSVILGMEVLLSTMKDAETGIRGYVLARTSDFLEPYNVAVRQVDARYVHLRQMVSDNVPQAERLSAAKAIMDKRMLLAATIVEFVRTGKDEAALAEVKSGRGKVLMDELRGQFVEMIAVERRLLIERRASSDQSFRIAIATIVLSAGVGLILLLLVASAERRRSALQARNSRMIREQGETLRVTMASIGDALISTDKSGRITYSNAVAEKLTGWKNDQAVGQPLETVFRIVNETTRQVVENPTMKALATGAIVGLANHTILIAQNGTEVHIDDSASPIKNEAGEVVGCVLIFRDIGQQRKAAQAIERSEARKTAMFQTALDSIITIDHNGIIVEFNSAAEGCFGHVCAEVVGKELAEVIIPHRYREGHRRGMAHYLATGEGPVLNKRMELSALRADGSEFPCELAITRVPVAGDPIFTAYLRDITERKTADDALRTSEEFNRVVLESSPDCLKVLDVEGRVVQMNTNGLCQMEIDDFGAFKGKAWCDLWPEADRRTVLDAVEDARTTGTGTFLRACPTAKGTPKWWDVSVAPIRDAANVVMGFVSVSRDITERMAVETAMLASEERFRMIADNMSQFAWTADPTGFIFWYNKRWYDYTGTTLGQMQGWGWREVHHPDHVDRVVKRLQHSLDTGELWEDTFPLRGIDGLYRWFLSRAEPVRDGEGKILRWFGTNTDITEERNAQVALRANEQRLRQMTAELSETDRRKNEFLAMLAHELRNPLAPIRNAIELMDMDTTDDPARRAVTQMMQRQVSQMVRLVDDLLDVSRVSNGKIALRKEPVDLNGVVQHAMEAVRPAMEGLGQHLEVNMPGGSMQVHGDPVRLAQVVGNLLNNASKFSERNGRVELSAKLENGHAAITVKDQGIGLSADELPRIFDLFVQADTSLERSTSGLGIGLTLVKSLVLLHGGTVEVHSDGSGKGSTFTVRLPVLVESPSTHLRNTSGGNGSVATGRKVLVVDDNRDAAQMLSLLLTKKGHTVRTAFDGLEAIVSAGTFQPEVMLLDIGLPNLNGYEVAKRIRQEVWGKEVFLVALTGWGQEEDRRRSTEAGFNKHLVKPVDMNELDNVLKEAAN
jgi:PAS domain S-box-containing protein